MLVDSSFRVGNGKMVLVAMSFLFFAAVIPAGAQGGSPLPGGGAGMQAMDPGGSAPVPGADSAGAAASHNFASGVPAANSKYAQLPLNIFDAKSRMSELRMMANAGRPQEVLEAVNRLSEWLGDMCDAHNRMAQVFAKHDQTKLQAVAEKLAVQKFSQVRNQAQLLKAEMLMQQHRFAEALNPLVDICIAEPTSATGQAAYGKLKELGFAEDPSPEAVAAATAATEAAESAKHAAPAKTSAAITPALKRIR
ncbi:MAG TPA: hypothetical protein V6C97_07260 [Oculatellaceae cyanobacterium]